MTENTLVTDDFQMIALQEQLSAANKDKQSLAIVGANTKAFLGREIDPNNNAVATLPVAAYKGIVDYEPSELVLTARCGTPLSDIEKVLSEQRQMLAFEPPQFTAQSTLGGTLASGLSGPRRISCGAARDFILGTNILNGQGQYLRFGGQVMKNVAGYDVSRLMVGSMGTLGVIMQASLKVLPMPEREITLAKTMSEQQALEQMTQYSCSGLPISGSCYHGQTLSLRLSGSKARLQQAEQRIGGEKLGDKVAERFWQQLRDQRLGFFADSQTMLEAGNALWRLSVPLATPPLALSGQQLFEWHGALRWLYTDMKPERIRAELEKVNGFAQCYRGGDRQADVFQPVNSGLAAIQQRLKQAFDPNAIFNAERFSLNPS